MIKKVTCVIPFLNEEGRIEKILAEIIRVRNIDQIICVNGGSTDKGYDVVKNNFPQIELIKLTKNIGKTDTVKAGLNNATGDYILLYDADLTNVNYLEVERVINKIKNDEQVDLIIFNRHTKRLVTKLNRMELIFSGERILKKSDLIAILKTRPIGFQLETAINTYMIKNRKNVLWFQSSNTNLPKANKFGSFKGMLKDLTMFWEVFKYDPVSYLYQLLFFARKRLIINK